MTAIALPNLFFDFLLPARAEDDGDRAHHDGFYAAGPETSTRRVFRRDGQRAILYVEDDLADAALLNRAMEETGSAARLVVFADPSEALLVCANAPAAPDLVVIDINMPKLGGLQLLGRLKSLPAFSRTRFVLLTTSDNEFYRRQAADLGADDYVVKPFGYTGYTDIAASLAKRLSS